VHSPSSLISQIEQFLECHSIRPERIVVAVSGGPDSVALLLALAALHTRQSVPTTVGSGLIVVAHFNHRLRGTESDEDEAFVRQLGALVGIKGSQNVLFRCERADTDKRARLDRDNLESVARRLRYDWLIRVAGELEVPLVATGHTLDDQAETVLHRLLRGTGLKGLSGIAPRRPLAPGIELVRPLLQVRRAEVLHYLEEERQPYRSDSSNADLTYTRNRIRHELLPHLAKQYSAAIVPLLGRLAGQAAATTAEHEALARMLLAQVELPKAGNRLVLDRRSLASLPRHLVREIFRLAWAREGWPMRAMGYSEWDRLAALTFDEIAATDLPGGIRAQAREQVVVVGPVL
jgi:tRNA(Ile)-lysidine synthase